MSELILIRHAQASFGHENYDNLSALGHDQAALLGSLFERLKITPDRVVIGTQKRHLQTLDSKEGFAKTNLGQLNCWRKFASDKQFVPQKMTQQLFGKSNN